MLHETHLLAAAAAAAAPASETRHAPPDKSPHRAQETSMPRGAFTLSLILLLTVGASERSGATVPRTSWKHQDVVLYEFSEPGIFNYTTLLLHDQRGVLYVGAREAIFELSLTNISVKNNEVAWKVPDTNICTLKGKSKETDCLNYIRVLELLSDNRLYVCGTHAFQPLCDYLSLEDFKLEGSKEDGRGKCSFDPAQSFTTVMVDGDLYSGTAYNFLGSEPIISRNSATQSTLRTEYSTSWLNEPSFVFADVVRESEGSTSGEDDKIYFFFTEASVEYDFFDKLLIPRVARVCKGDLGGQRTLQKKWTSFLKAKLVCSVPETNFIFNVVHDVFLLKRANWRESVIYGIFTSQWGNVGSSAVCAYNMSAVEEVFSTGKYMQKSTVEQSHTKWVRYNGVPPSPRPGACITNHLRDQKITSSLLLPDKTLQFVRDHPLLEDPVFPVGNSPRLVTKDVRYTQIAVQRVRALDGQLYDVMFTGTDKGKLHKSVVYETEVHIVEEVQLFPDCEPVKTLVLPSQGARFLYVGSDSRVVQSPTAFCEKYPKCEDCLLARDPYCGWDPGARACVNILQESHSRRELIQSLQGSADRCPRGHSKSREKYQQLWVKPGGAVELPCQIASNVARTVWRVNGSAVQERSAPYQRTVAGLLVYGGGPEVPGLYECWAVEEVNRRNYTWLLRRFALALNSAGGRRPDPAATEDPRLATGGEVGFTGWPTPPFEPTRLLLTSPVPQPTRNLDPLAPQYLESNSSVTLLLFLTLLFSLLFLAVLSYNCYMRYLPGPCLQARAALLGAEKSPQPEYRSCEAGPADNVVDQHQGHSKGAACQRPPSTKPFDVDSEAQPIEYADADGEETPRAALVVCGRFCTGSSSSTAAQRKLPTAADVAGVRRLSLVNSGLSQPYLRHHEPHGSAGWIFNQGARALRWL
ncbi:semaphorin-4D-like isoform X1 [Arapaima gigas]